LTSGILSSLDHGVGHVVLNRPENHNAINKEMWAAIPPLLTALQKQGARSIIIHGEGDDFSSGANTSEAAQLKNYDDAKDLWHSIRNSLQAVYEFELPTIAMIHGACFGGGCLLATACDCALPLKRRCLPFRLPGWD